MNCWKMVSKFLDSARFIRFKDLEVCRFQTGSLCLLKSYMGSGFKIVYSLIVIWSLFQRGKFLKWNKPSVICSVFAKCQPMRQTIASFIGKQLKFAVIWSRIFCLMFEPFNCQPSTIACYQPFRICLLSTAQLPAVFLVIALFVTCLPCDLSTICNLGFWICGLTHGLAVLKPRCFASCSFLACQWLVSGSFLACPRSVSFLFTISSVTLISCLQSCLSLNALLALRHIVYNLKSRKSLLPLFHFWFRLSIWLRRSRICKCR